MKALIFAATAALVVAAAAAQAAQPTQPGSVDIRSKCRAEAMAKGFRNQALKTAVDECVLRVDPNLSAEFKCRNIGQAKGLKGNDLQAFTRQCRTAG